MYIGMGCYDEFLRNNVAQSPFSHHPVLGLRCGGNLGLLAIELESERNKKHRIK